MNDLPEGLKLLLVTLLSAAAIAGLGFLAIGALVPGFADSAGLGSSDLADELGTSLVGFSEFVRFRPLLDIPLILASYVLACLLRWLQEVGPVLWTNRRRLR